MRIWKIGSGALSAALSLYVVCQAFWGGALNLLAGEAPSGAAGLVAALARLLPWSASLLVPLAAILLAALVWLAV